MGINPNQINITDNTGSSAVEGSVVVSKSGGDHVWSSNSTTALKLPTGDTSQRITLGRTGHIRFNTTLKTVELYSETAPIGWRSVGQLNLDGTAAAPAISFSNDTDVGFFRPTENQIALSVAGAQRVLWTATNQTISTNLTVLGTITTNALVYSGPSAALAPLPTETLSMLDGANNVAVGGSMIYPAATRAGMYIDYILKRGTNYKIGTLVVANSTTSAQVAERAYAQPVDIGVSFGVNISGANVVVTYTSSTIGQAITGKFSIRRWDVF